MSTSASRIASEVARCTCLRVRRAARRVTQRYDHALEPAGVTVTQFGLLAHLAQLDAPSIGELAERLGMDPTTLNRNLRPMIEAGLVGVAPDEADRRVRCVRLSDAGRATFRAAVPHWRRAQAEIDRALGRDDLERLHALLSRLGR